MTLQAILNGILTTHTTWIMRLPAGDIEYALWSTAHANPPMR